MMSAVFNLSRIKANYLLINKCNTGSDANISRTHTGIHTHKINEIK